MESYIKGYGFFHKYYRFLLVAVLLSSAARQLVSNWNPPSLLLIKTGKLVGVIIYKLLSLPKRINLEVVE